MSGDVALSGFVLGCWGAGDFSAGTQNSVTGKSISAEGGDGV